MSPWGNQGWEGIHRISLGAEDGIRTRDLLLGKETLYQLSYFRDLVKMNQSLQKGIGGGYAPSRIFYRTPARRVPWPQHRDPGTIATMQ